MLIRSHATRRDKCSQQGRFVSKVLMGKPIVFVMGEKSHLIALRCAVGVFPPGLQKKKKKKEKE